MNLTYFDAIEARIAAASTQAELDALAADALGRLAAATTGLADASAALPKIPKPEDVTNPMTVMSALKDLLTALAGPPAAAAAAIAAETAVVTAKTAQITTLVASKTAELSQVPSVP